jgi:hypothetical protein
MEADRPPQADKFDWLLLSTGVIGALVAFAGVYLLF